MFCILQFRKEGIEHLENKIVDFPVSVIVRSSFGTEFWANEIQQ